MFAACVDKLPFATSSRPQINKMQWLDLEAFFAEHIPPTPWHEPKRKVKHAFDDMPIDFDALVCIMVISWRSYSNAPRLAAVARSWKEATKEAEKMVRSEDVPVPRLRIAQPLLPPLEPTLSTAEHVVRDSWGAELGAYTPFILSAPAAGNPIRCTYELQDMQSTVLIGHYLNSITIDAFLTSLMPDMVKAARASPQSSLLHPRNFFIPTIFSASIIEDGNFGRAEYYVEKAFNHTDHLHITMHYKETTTHAEHWVHVRATKAVRKVEIFEPAALVQCNFIGRQLLCALVAARAITAAEADGWTVVLYNRHQHHMPRQSDGSSCGVFACVVALHLVEVRRIPRNIQEEIMQWRLYIAMKVFGKARRVLERQ